MRNPLPEVLEASRVIDGPMASDRSWGAYGMFRLYRERGSKTEVRIVASGGDPDDPMSEGWEHVSISTATRCPTWEEMCRVKDLFWGDDEAVLQFHPPKSEYVNNHPYCLHLWKPPYPVVMPPSLLVGIKSAGVLTAGAAALLNARLRRQATYPQPTRAHSSPTDQ